MTAQVLLIVTTLLSQAVINEVLVERPDPDEVSELEWQIEFVIERGEPGDCGNLIEMFALYGFRTLREEALSLVRDNMPLLEDCIVESQRAPHRVDQILHSEFRRNASPEAITAMRSVLGDQIFVPHELARLEDPEVSASKDARREAEKATRRLLETVEILADYRHPEDAEFLAALCDRLRETQAESLWSTTTEPPSWFVHMALRRFEDPSAGAVLWPNRSGGWDLVPEASEITGTEIRSFPDPRLGWHSLPLPAQRVAEILLRLGASPLKERGRGVQYCNTVTLRIRFEDGVVAEVTAHDQGWVLFEDNRRATDSGFAVVNEALANEIIDLVNLVAPADQTDVH